LQQVEERLAEQDFKGALEVVSRPKFKSPWLTNAAGVCQLRQGNYSVALNSFRGLVMSSGLSLRTDVPDVFKANFAVALLAMGNFEGGASALAELRNSPHPAVAQITEAYGKWKGSLSLWKRICWTVAGASPGTVTFDFPLGELR
jgi:hypothetical protein